MSLPASSGSLAVVSHFVIRCCPSFSKSTLALDRISPANPWRNIKTKDLADRQISRSVWVEVKSHSRATLLSGAISAEYHGHEKAARRRLDAHL